MVLRLPARMRKEFLLALSVAVLALITNGVATEEFETNAWVDEGIEDEGEDLKGEQDSRNNYHGKIPYRRGMYGGARGPYGQGGMKPPRRNYGESYEVLGRNCNRFHQKKVATLPLLDETTFSPFQPDYSESGYERRAEVYIEGIKGSGVYGYVSFYQYDCRSPVVIVGDIYGLKPGGHGIHVHNGTSTGYNCDCVGVHYNPFHEKHGGPYDSERHAGDFGNIFAKAMKYEQKYERQYEPKREYGYGQEYGYEKTRAHLSLRIKDRRTTLFGPYAIIDKAIVVHTGMDDLGRGGTPESPINGNSGTPIGCGIIRLKQTERKQMY